MFNIMEWCCNVTPKHKQSHITFNIQSSNVDIHTNILILSIPILLNLSLIIHTVEKSFLFETHRSINDYNAALYTTHDTFIL